MSKFFSKVWATLGAVALVGGVVGPALAGDISGAGATFPYPIYAKWAEAYKQQTGIGLNYQSIGSGGGIKQIEAGTVTFGASDKPLEAADLKQQRNESRAVNQTQRTQHYPARDQPVRRALLRAEQGHNLPHASI